MRKAALATTFPAASATRIQSPAARMWTAPSRPSTPRAATDPVTAVIRRWPRLVLLTSLISPTVAPATCPKRPGPQQGQRHASSLTAHPEKDRQNRGQQILPRAHARGFFLLVRQKGSPGRACPPPPFLLAYCFGKFSFCLHGLHRPDEPIWRGQEYPSLPGKSPVCPASNVRVPFPHFNQHGGGVTQGADIL